MSLDFRQVALVLMLFLLLIGCGTDEPTATIALPAKSSTVKLTNTSTPPPTEPPPTEKPTAQPTATAQRTATAEPTSTPSPVPTEPAAMSGAVSDIVASLEGLPIDEFFEESYKQLLLRNPEYLTNVGLADAYGLRHDRLNDLSDAYVRETQQLESAILALLQGYDRAALTSDQQVSYDVYEWYLDDLVRGHEFMYYDYPITHFIGSWDDELIRLFTELHPLDHQQDAEDYISRLSQVDDQVEQLLDGLKRREEMGVIPPKFIVGMALQNLQRHRKQQPSLHTILHSVS